MERKNSKWKILQELIKDEMILSDIISKSQDNNLTKIKQNYFSYFQNHLKIRENFDFIQNFAKDSEKVIYRKYEIIADHENALIELSEPILKLFERFRNDIKSLAKVLILIEKSKSQYTKHDVNSFVEVITKSFFENCLIEDERNDEFLSLIYLLVEHEIDKLTETTFSNFMNSDSILHKLLRSYLRKPKIKNFAASLLNDIITKIQNSEEFLELDPIKIQQNIDKNTYTLKKLNTLSVGTLENKKIAKTSIIIKSNKKKSFVLSGGEYEIESKKTKISRADDSFISDELEENRKIQKIVNQDYNIDITQEALSGKLHGTTNKILLQFYRSHIDKMHDDQLTYSNTPFEATLKGLKDTQEIFTIYVKNFEKIKKYFDKIFNNFISKLDTMPYDFRCILKIIDIIVVKKFPDISEYNRIKFLSEILFENWLMPILASPDYTTVFSKSVISENTRKNLFNLTRIFRKIGRLNFFECKIEPNYTLFNNYIIDIIPPLVTFFYSILEVKIPNEIEVYHNENIFKNNDKSYFQKNPKELISIQPYLFNINDVLFLYKIIKNNISHFDNDDLLTRIVEKIDNQENFIKKITQNQPDEIVNYFLMLNTEFNSEAITSLNKRKISLSRLSNDSEIEKIKSCIQVILKGVSLFDICSTDNEDLDTFDFFSRLSKRVMLEDHESSINMKKIPLNWYFMYLLSNIEDIDENYSDNDYDKLYKEIMKGIDSSIKSLNTLNYNFSTKYGLNINSLEKCKEELEIDLEKVREVEFNIKVAYFIKKTNFHVCIENVNESNIKINEQNQKKGISIIIRNLWECPYQNTESEFDFHVETIDQFISTILSFQEIRDDINFGTNRYRIQEIIKNYLKFLTSSINETYIFKLTKTNPELVMDEIEDYIDKKIFIELFPSFPNKNDNDFFRRTCILNWVTPEMLDIKDGYINDGIWDLAINFMKNLKNEKSPKMKLKMIETSYMAIYNSVCFSKGEDSGSLPGVDDILPIFIYVLIKSHPKRLFSTMQVIENIMNNDKLTSKYGYLISNLALAVNYINSINHEKLKISEDIFKKNCERLKRKFDNKNSNN